MRFCYGHKGLCMLLSFLEEQLKHSLTSSFREFRLDVGCAVGASSFVLAQYFDHVLA